LTPHQEPSEASVGEICH